MQSKIQHLKNGICCSWDTFRREEGGRFCFSALITFLLGLAAHGYAFLNYMPSHDSLTAVTSSAFEERWKVTLGRIFVPLYRLVRGYASAPWLIGLLALVWIGLAVYLTLRMFDLKKRWLMVLFAGIMVTNVTVTAVTATYLYELDFDMFALLTSVGAAYLWSRGGWRSLGAGALLTTATLGLYQSYFCVSVTLIVFYCITLLLRGEEALAVLIRGLRGIGMLLAGAIIYGIAAKLAVLAVGVTTQETGYNGLGNLKGIWTAAIPRLKETYTVWFCYFTEAVSFEKSVIRLMNLAVLLTDGAIIVVLSCKRRVSFLSKGLVAVLTLLMPLIMNLACFGAGMCHDLMKYAFCFVYLLPLILLERIPVLGGRVLRGFCGVLTAAIVFASIRTSNALYLKKDVEYTRTASVMTRAVIQMHEISGYQAGETPVMFTGYNVPAGTVLGLEEYGGISGSGQNLAITNAGPVYYYFWDMLGEPINLASEEQCRRIEETVDLTQKPVFPEDGYAFMQDGVLVVNLPE